jgi:hypothetical protein
MTQVAAGVLRLDELAADFEADATVGASNQSYTFPSGHLRSLEGGCS